MGFCADVTRLPECYEKRGGAYLTCRRVDCLVIDDHKVVELPALVYVQCKERPTVAVAADVEGPCAPSKAKEQT